jgi:hypothetical protein
MRAGLLALVCLTLMTGTAVDAAIIVDPASAVEPHAAATTYAPGTRALVSGEATAARSGTARDVFEFGDDRLRELPEALIWLTMMLGCLGVGFALHRGDTEAPVRMRFP